MDVRSNKREDPDETWVWERFKFAWPWRCQRQDPNGGHNSGIPDVHLLDSKGNRGLVELKRPKRVELRPSQWLWHESDQEGGGVSCVVTCEGLKKEPIWYVYRIDVRKRHLQRVSLPALTSNGMVVSVLNILGLNGYKRLRSRNDG